MQVVVLIVALCLVGAGLMTGGIYLLLGAGAAMIFAGLMLLAAAFVVRLGVVRG